MRYPCGEEARLGDRVRLGDAEGVVVCSLDSGEFSETYPPDDWSYLNRGVLVEFPTLGLIHYVDPEEELQFVRRDESTADP